MSFLSRVFKFREMGEADEENLKPFLSHLEDLRWTLVKVVATIILGVVVSFFFRNELMSVLQKPLRDIDPTLSSNLLVLGIYDPFFIVLKLSFYAGIVLTFPLLLYFIAEFVVPALTTREKKLVLPLIALGFALFLTGVWIAYEYLLPHTLQFFFGFSRDLGFKQEPTATAYFSFVAQMCIALGVAAELPILVMTLNFLGILSSALMRKTRIFATPLMFAFAALIAPTPDPFTMFAIALPMLALYELCIWLAWLLDRRRSRNALVPR